MSISSALSNAISGLTASARSAGVVSSNLANVMTEGYAVRQISLVARGGGLGGGVQVQGVTRNVDQALLGERRLADSEVAYASALLDFSAKLETAFGTPDDPSSLSARVAALEATLITAAARPEENVRLRDVGLKASDLSQKLNDISKRIERERGALDRGIGDAVETINTMLLQVQHLNTQIVQAKATGYSSASLEDQRQVTLDGLAEFVPFRLASRDSGAVAIYTPGGAVLLDGKAARLSFSSANIVAPHMTVQNGLLSGLSINGIPVDGVGPRSPVAGGRLSALFEARDQVAPQAQAQIDAIARNLIERFEQPGVDPTRTLGGTGFFTDSGAPLDPAAEVGLAGRIEINVLVDETRGGALWRIRDGLGSAMPGSPGDASLLQRLTDALADNGGMPSGDLGGTERSFSGHISTLGSMLGQDRLSAEQSLSFASTLQTGLRETELSKGVDSDEQLQRLLLIEQSYAANARMVQTVEDMIDTLMRI